MDIQALAHVVELTRQGAVDSLKFAKGDLFQAFQVSLHYNGQLELLLIQSFCEMTFLTLVVNIMKCVG